MAARKSKSTVGRSLDEVVAEREAHEPEFAAARKRLAPLVEIANTVTLGRERLGLTQEQLAREIGTTKSAISRIESGSHAMSVNTLLRLSERLDTAFEIRPAAE